MGGFSVLPLALLQIFPTQIDKAKLEQLYRKASFSQTIDLNDDDYKKRSHLPVGGGDDKKKKTKSKKWTDIPPKKPKAKDKSKKGEIKPPVDKAPGPLFNESDGLMPPIKPKKKTASEVASDLVANKTASILSSIKDPKAKASAINIYKEYVSFLDRMIAGEVPMPKAHNLFTSQLKAVKDLSKDTKGKIAAIANMHLILMVFDLTIKGQKLPMDLTDHMAYMARTIKTMKAHVKATPSKLDNEVYNKLLPQILKVTKKFAQMTRPM